MAIQEGSVVWLKSGGQKMTTEKANGSDYYYCVWFDKKQEFQRESIKTITLTEEDPNQIYLGSV